MLAAPHPLTVLEAVVEGERQHAQWGLDAPADAPAVWGARAIDLSITGWDLLPDRQDSRGTPAAVSALLHLLHTGGALVRAVDTYKTLCSVGEVGSNITRRVVLLDHPILRIEANTNGSRGYVYLVAYLRCDPSRYTLSKVYTEGQAADVATWSRDDSDLPALGEEVVVTRGVQWATVARNQKMTILGYSVDCGHLHAWGALSSPSQKKLAQDKRQSERAVAEGRPHKAWTFPGTWNVMGREWERPLVVAFGYSEVNDQNEMQRIQALKNRADRQVAYRLSRRTAGDRYAHVTEVYAALVGPDGDETIALLFDRQYCLLGQVSAEVACDLITRSTVTSRWEDYTLHGVTGCAIWLAHPGSTDAGRV